MNTWEDDERLYRSAFDPNAQAAREIESLREEVANLTREILALKKELAAAKKETAPPEKHSVKKKAMRNMQIVKKKVTRLPMNSLS